MRLRRPIPYLLVLIPLILTAFAITRPTDQQPRTSRNVPPAQTELLIADAALSADENRLAFTFWTGTSRLPAAENLWVTIRPTANSAPIWQGTPTEYLDHDGPYWVAYPEFANLATPLLEITYTDATNQPVTLTKSLNLTTPPTGITPGLSAPVTNSPVWDTNIGLVSSDRSPNPAFYQQTIAQAIATGRPTLILFSTPAVCTRKLCGPIMESFKTLWGQYGEAVNFIHVEAIDLTTGDLTPTMQAWQLNPAQQPLLYMVDAAGKVVARYDSIFSPAELTPVLDGMVAETAAESSEPIVDTSMEESTVSDLPNMEERIVSDLPNLGPAPELYNSVWLNTDAPLRLADLRGQVVLLEMWTFDCINCINITPYVRTWHDTYAAQGLVVIGNHYPEYDFEADLDNLKAAVLRLEITYPVAQDNDGGTWGAYNNRYWPALYLIDKWGNIRYKKFGEGSYGLTEANIVKLLAETYP